MIETAALLRIIPYLMVAVLAYQKGYKWLTVVAVWVSIIAFSVFTFDLSTEVRALLGSITSILLLVHVSNLKSRRN